MKTFEVFVLLNLFFISSFAKTFVVCAETGAGKSTLSSSLFGVDAPTGMYNSQTRTTTKYPATARAVSAFQDAVIYDTPGTLDTSGITNEEIMDEIETHYLKEMNSGGETALDGFIFIISTKQTRIRFGDLINNFASSFSPSVLKSMVIVINWFDSEPWEKAQEMKTRVERQANGISDAAFDSEFVQIPVLIMNAKNPTPDQINALASALSDVQKYRLVDLEKKAEEVRKIFEDLMNDPNNFKEVREKIVKELDTEIEEQAFKKVPLVVTDERVQGCRFGLDLGVLSFCIPNKVSEKKTLLVDQEVTLVKKEKRPVIEDKISQVLKNEEDVLWKQAVDIFNKRNLEKYVKRQPNDGFDKSNLRKDAKNLPNYDL